MIKLNPMLNEQYTVRKDPNYPGKFAVFMKSATGQPHYMSGNYSTREAAWRAVDSIQYNEGTASKPKVSVHEDKSTFKCQECGRKLSSSARKCSGCGSYDIDINPAPAPLKNEPAKPKTENKLPHLRTFIPKSK